MGYNDKCLHLQQYIVGCYKLKKNANYVFEVFSNGEVWHTMWIFDFNVNKTVFIEHFYLLQRIEISVEMIRKMHFLSNCVGLWFQWIWIVSMISIHVSLRPLLNTVIFPFLRF